MYTRKPDDPRGFPFHKKYFMNDLYGDEIVDDTQSGHTSTASSDSVTEMTGYGRQEDTPPVPPAVTVTDGDQPSKVPSASRARSNSEVSENTRRKIIGRPVYDHKHRIYYTEHDTIEEVLQRSRPEVDFARHFYEFNMKNSTQLARIHGYPGMEDREFGTPLSLSDGKITSFLADVKGTQDASKARRRSISSVDLVGVGHVGTQVLETQLVSQVLGTQ